MAERVRGLHRWVGAIAGVSVLMLPTACGSDDKAPVATTPDATVTPTPKPQPSGPPTVSIRNNKASPSSLEVETGGTLRIRNDDSVGHRLDNRANHLYSGTIPARGKGELTMPPDKGSYVFTDPGHPSVRVKVQVR